MGIEAPVVAAPIGHNNPPATPYEALKAHIDDLEMEARNYLDGKPIETDEQAADISRILDDARKARVEAEAQRKLEAKPFDDGKAEVQALWTPLTDEKKGRCALIAATCKQVLAEFLQKKEDAQRAAAEAARLEAEEKAAAARKAAEIASPGDLAGLTTARVLKEAAEDAAKRAGRLEKQKVQAKGGERAVSLRTAYGAEITDPIAFGKWAWEHRREEYLAFLTSLAIRECRNGPRDIPGVRVTEGRKAV